MKGWVFLPDYNKKLFVIYYVCMSIPTVANVFDLAFGWHSPPASTHTHNFRAQFCIASRWIYLTWPTMWILISRLGDSGTYTKKKNVQNNIGSGMRTAAKYREYRSRSSELNGKRKRRTTMCGSQLSSFSAENRRGIKTENQAKELCR